MMRKQPHGGVAGFSMIEVLVSLLVLGIGIMGYAALQLKSVRLTDQSYDRSQAVFIAQDLIERVRANGGISQLATYGNQAHWAGEAPAVAAQCTFVSGVPTPDNRCDPAVLAQEDIAQIRDITRRYLTQGEIALQPCNQMYCVQVAWNGTALADCDESLFTDGVRDKNAHCVTVEFYP